MMEPYVNFSDDIRKEAAMEETYHAMIGNIGYMRHKAQNDDEARAWFAIQMHHRGAGLYERWRDNGMRVAVFKRGVSIKPERRIDSYEEQN